MTNFVVYFNNGQIIQVTSDTSDNARLAALKIVRYNNWQAQLWAVKVVRT
jgi:hypothetical protein